MKRYKGHYRVLILNTPNYTCNLHQKRKKYITKYEQKLHTHKVKIINKISKNFSIFLYDINGKKKKQYQKLSIIELIKDIKGLNDLKDIKGKKGLSLYADYSKKGIKNLGYKNRKKAIYTINKIKYKNKTYQLSVLNTMIYRAKNHPYKNKDMDIAIELFYKRVKILT